ncbi:hypothetical protein ADK67_12170 [Saccharothrix sp. NRRL B-16348]|uniref:hypothetical protein n=1 Tax=Saccharothrix sp. NRRL B-16348 TaxID=1415542 RepID=UPI0006B03AEC|nr:hypothetical protein [Saccharothrix sp. NRRL B-16348]KOX28187.1 hypothetical protein ADK67_12170 [Saccharothrix sp. NRRL B-16348]
MRTFRGAGACAAALLVATTLIGGAPAAAAAEPPAAPYTAFTSHFEGWGYIDGSFTYERSRNTLNVYQQTANGYALSMHGFTEGNRHWHHLNVSPPNGTRFEAGRSYPTQTNFYTSDSITVFNISGDGQGCEGAAATSGTLNVHEVAYDEATGQFTAFAADYSMRCGSAGRLAKGEIRFQSALGYRAADSWDYRLQFGQQPWGKPGTPLEVPVEATGTLPTTFGEASLTGPNPDAFEITANTCSGNTLSYGQKCALTVTPTATAIGAQTAQLTLPNDAVTGNVRRLLSLEGYHTDQGTYYPLAPHRVLDTRAGQGAPPVKVGAGQAIRLQVTGQGGVPAAASTVVLNVTVTEPGSAGHISIYPTDVARPTVSSLNYTPGWTGANSVTVKVGADGAVNLYNHGAPVHLIADINGYYSKGRIGYTGGQYHPLTTPVRLADTREWGIGRLPAGYYFNVTASWDDPSVNPRIRAFAVNITATDTRAPGFLTAWNGYGPGLPNTSTLNYAAGSTVTNFAVVPSRPCAECGSGTGDPSIGVYTSQDTHVVVDIVGFYDDSSLSGGLRFEPVVPDRIADTRTGLGWPAALAPATTATVVTPDHLAGTETWALATNVTAVEPTASTYLTVWPAGYTGVGRPNTSNLNPAAGAIVPNAVQTMIGPDYGFHVYNNSGRTHLLVDVVGTFYYEPSPTSSSAPSTRSRLTAPTVEAPKAAPLSRPHRA